MLNEEAAWFGERLPTGPPNGVVLNIGSSTNHYRTVMQPDIDRKIFEPLRERGYEVIHVDRKADDGVNLVGDLEDQRFVDRLKGLQPSLVFCNNVLMHLRPSTLRKVVAALSDIVPSGSLLYVSSSAIYPHTSDPYDNGLRVDAMQLAHLFGQFEVKEPAMISGSTSFLDDLKADRPWAARLFVRALIPFYKPRNWLELIRYLPRLATPYSAACAILRKQ